MQALRNTIKKHIGLTTLSLLEKKELWQRLGEQLPEGGMLIVIPKDNLKAARFLMKIAQSFREAGREVETLKI